MSLSIHRSCSDNGPTTVTEHKVNRLCCSDTGCQEKQVRFAPVAIRQSMITMKTIPRMLNPHGTTYKITKSSFMIDM